MDQPNAAAKVRIDPNSPVDPEIQVFVARVSEAYAAHPPFDRLTPDEAREVAEIVREPWRRGGPAMRRISERVLDVAPSPVRIRIYEPETRPEDGAPGPALVYSHGGGWMIFSLDTHDRLMREYAHRSGLLVIGVDYARAPEARFPIALEQVVGVTRWLRGHGPEIGVDPDRVALGGDSAGGNLSFGAALKLRDEGEPKAVAALLLNYTGFQPDCSDAAERAFGGPGFMLNRAEKKRFWSGYLASPDDARNPLAAPIGARLDGLPPVFLTVAECDILAEQNHLMARRLEKAGVATRVEVYRGATHSFLEAVSIAKIAERALEDGALWLRAQLT
ncbi:MAG: alpha/beta hydrolase [Caulobacteraceae bacterium]